MASSRPKVPRPSTRTPATAERRHFSHPEGTVIARVNDPVRCLFVLVKGELEIVAPKEAVQTITKVPTTAREAQIGAISNGRWTANIIARSPVTLLHLDIVQMYQVMERMKQDFEINAAQLRARLAEYIREAGIRDEHIRKLEAYADGLELKHTEVLERVAELERTERSLRVERRDLNNSAAGLQLNMDAMAAVHVENLLLKERLEELEAEVSESRQLRAEHRREIATRDARIAELEAKIVGLESEGVLIEIGEDGDLIDDSMRPTSPGEDPSLACTTELGLAPPSTVMSPEPFESEIPPMRPRAETISFEDSVSAAAAGFGPGESPTGDFIMPIEESDGETGPVEVGDGWVNEWPSFRLSVPTPGVDPDAEEEQPSRPTIVGPPPSSPPPVVKPERLRPLDAPPTRVPRPGQR